MNTKHSLNVKVLLVILATLLTLAGLIFYGIESKENHRSAERKENLRLIEVQQIEIDNASERYDLAINFILDHMPKMSEEILDELEITLRNTFTFHSTDKSESIDTREIGLSNVIGQLTSAIKNNDLTLFLGAFETITYINYINQFNSAEEKENGLKAVLERLSREGKFQKASFIEPTSYNKPVTIFLTYSDNREIELSLEFVSVVDHHTHELGNEFLFTTSFEDMLKQIE